MIPEILDHPFLEGSGLPGEPGIEGGAVEFQETPDQKGVVVRMASDPGGPSPIPVEQAVVFVLQIRKDEPGRVFRRIGPFGAAENPGTHGQGGDHQAVPVGEDLVVLQGMDPFLPASEERFPDRRPLRAEGYRVRVQILGPPVQGLGEVRDAGAGPLAGGFVSEVALRRQVEHGGPPLCRLFPEDLPEFLQGPDVELPLFPFAVRILGGVEGACGVGHIPEHIGEDLLGGPGVEGVPGDLVGFQVSHGQQGLIVEHLFEMGQQPLSVRGISVESETDVIPHPPQPHGGEGLFHHSEGLVVPGMVVVPEEEEELVGGRKFGGPTEPAVLPVEASPDLGEGALQHIGADLPGPLVAEGPGQVARDGARRLQELFPLAGPELLDLGTEFDQPRSAEPVPPGDVGAGEEGLFVRGHEDGEGPAAAARHHLTCGHIDGVDVGTLLPIHLDADEGIVEVAGRRFILEGFPLHDVAPVAGGVSHGQEDRLVLLLGLFKGRVAPRVPVHRITGVLKQIWALFMDQSILVHGAWSFLPSHPD